MSTELDFKCRTFPIDWNAKVYRTQIGELIQWSYGSEIKHGIVRWLADEDSAWSGDDTPFYNGSYLGRLATIECIDDKCLRCKGAEKKFAEIGEHGQKWWAHYCNESQLSPVTESVSVQGVLF